MSDEDDEMDWAWSMNGGEVVYGSAGMAVSPRAMRGEIGNVCARCCGCGGGAGGDVDMELYVIDEEEGEVDGR